MLEQPSVRSTAYRNYLLGLLTVILLFNYVDRIALGIVLEDIKVDLDLTDTELGFLSGIAFALFYSVMGIPIARWADRGHRVLIIDERLQLKAMAIAIAVAGILSSAAYLMSNQYWVFGLVGLSLLAHSTINGPLFSTIQTLVPDRMRAVAFALVYLFANLIGMGIGPLAVGMLSDAFRPWAGEESLRYAFLILGPGYFASAWLMWRASRTVARDIEAAPTEQRARSRCGTADPETPIEANLI